jgi:hypothetical protein
MPNENSQAAPEEQVTTQGAQVPGQTTEQVSTPAEPQKERTLTLEDVQREATRIAQSLVAKGENRINQRIQEQFSALEMSKKALGLSDEQVAQAKQKIVTDAFTASEPETTGEQPGNPPAVSVDQAIQYLNDQITAVFDVEGTTVNPSDPESKIIQEAMDRSWNDRNGLAIILGAARKAATTKAQREASQKETAASRVISGGGNGPGEQSAASAQDYWNKAHK